MLLKSVQNNLFEGESQIFPLLKKSGKYNQSHESMAKLKIVNFEYNTINFHKQMNFYN